MGSFDNAIFLVGAAKSGTTILATILLRHPDLGPKPKIDMMNLDELVNQKRRKRHTVQQERMRTWLHYMPSPSILLKNPMSPQKTLALKKDLSRGFKEKRFFNKFPRNLLRVHMLRDIWPDCDIIALRRNPADVIASRCDRDDKKHAQYVVGGWPAAIKKYAADWRLNNDHLNKYKKEFDIHVIEYENMVSNPMPTLKRLYDRLNLGNLPDVTMISRIGTWQKRVPDKYHALLIDEVKSLKYDRTIPGISS